MKNPKQPLVTVAISSYNHENYIHESLKSIFNQTYQNIELIVFDDGSTDDTPQIIENLASEHSFFFKKNSNLGLPQSLNKILSIAKGKYITGLASDDIAMLDKIEKQVALMESDDSISLCGGNILKIDQFGTTSSKQKIYPYHSLNFEEIFLNKAPRIPAPTLFFRTSTLKELGGYSQKAEIEDLYMLLKVSELNHKIIFMNDVLAYYRVHPTNTYKNLEFMYANIIATFDHFKSSPYYTTACKKALISMFLKATKNNKPFARKLLKQIKPSDYSTKVIRGVIRLIMS